MNWLEFSQRVLGLIEYAEEAKEYEEEYPKTLDKIIELLEQIDNLMDEPIEVQMGVRK